MNTTVKVLSGFLAGATVGAIAGVLLAPDKGSNTRKKIQDESKRLSGEIAESVSQTIHALTHAYRDRPRKEEYENGKMERSKAIA